MEPARFGFHGDDALAQLIARAHRRQVTVETRIGSGVPCPEEPKLLAMMDLLEAALSCAGRFRSRLRPPMRALIAG